MSQPTIESVIEKEIENLGNIGRDDSNIRIALEKIADLARSEERTRCVEIVKEFIVDTEDLEDEFGIYENSNRTCDCIIKAINTNK